VSKRRTRAEGAIDEVRGRASEAVETVVDSVEEAIGGAKRRTKKSRKRIEQSARKAERKLGRFWNRGRLRVRRVRGKATRRIDSAAKRASKLTKS
jgi:uncharacterized protein YjbJ (UPF0337 family)